LTEERVVTLEIQLSEKEAKVLTEAWRFYGNAMGRPDLGPFSVDKMLEDRHDVFRIQAEIRLNQNVFCPLAVAVADQ